MPLLPSNRPVSLKALCSRLAESRKRRRALTVSTARWDACDRQPPAGASARHPSHNAWRTTALRAHCARIHRCRRMPTLSAVVLCPAVGISDRDTVKVRCGEAAEEKVRLLQADAPEEKHAFGTKAKLLKPTRSSTAEDSGRMPHRCPLELRHPAKAEMSSPEP